MPCNILVKPINQSGPNHTTKPVHAKLSLNLLVKYSNQLDQLKSIFII